MAGVEALAPVTGTVWKIEVRKGDAVAAGDVVMVLESMKMEIAVTAPCDGVVAGILVGEQDPVNEDQPVAIVETAS